MSRERELGRVVKWYVWTQRAIRFTRQVVIIFVEPQKRAGHDEIDEMI